VNAVPWAKALRKAAFSPATTRRLRSQAVTRADLVADLRQSPKSGIETVRKARVTSVCMFFIVRLFVLMTSSQQRDFIVHLTMRNSFLKRIIPRSRGWAGGAQEGDLNRRTFFNSGVVRALF
jgi:hypothetical protein